MPSDPQLAAYLYGIENIYPNFATSQRSAAKTNILVVSRIMAELEDEAQTMHDFTTLRTYLRVVTLSKSCDRGNRLTKSYERSSYTNRQRKSSEVCSHCHM